MSLTGVLAFKPQIQRVVDRSVRIVQPPGEGAARLGVQTMVANVRLAKPEGQLQSIALESDPTLSAAVSLGRDATVDVDPYTGRVLGEGTRSLQTSFARWRTGTDGLACRPRTGSTGRAPTGRGVVLVWTRLSRGGG